MNEPMIVQVFDGPPAHAGFAREALADIAQIQVIVITYLHGRLQPHVHVSEPDNALALLQALYAVLSVLRN